MFCSKMAWTCDLTVYCCNKIAANFIVFYQVAANLTVFRCGQIAANLTNLICCWWEKETSHLDVSFTHKGICLPSRENWKLSFWEGVCGVNVLCIPPYNSTYWKFEIQPLVPRISNIEFYCILVSDKMAFLWMIYNKFISKHVMRGSRKFCKRGSNFDSMRGERIQIPFIISEPSSARQRNAILMLAGRWWLLKVVSGSSSSLVNWKKTNNKKRCQCWTPSGKTSWIRACNR